MIKETEYFAGTEMIFLYNLLSRFAKENENWLTQVELFIQIKMTLNEIIWMWHLNT